MVANDENLKRLTPSEAREYGQRGGKASGEARRRKADFRRDINLLLTTPLSDGDISDQLRAMGLEPTIGMAMHMKMAVEALKKGNVKAYEALAKYAGQSDQPDEDIKNREADTELKRARRQAVTGENETDEALERLDEILKGMSENAVKQETE